MCVTGAVVCNGDWCDLQVGTVTSSAATVTVQAATAVPSFSGPADVTAAVGAPATFVSGATGGGLFLQWYRVGTGAIAGATSLTYTITAAVGTAVRAVVLLVCTSRALDVCSRSSLCAVPYRPRVPACLCPPMVAPQPMTGLVSTVSQPTPWALPPARRRTCACPLPSLRAQSPPPSPWAPLLPSQSLPWAQA